MVSAYDWGTAPEGLATRRQLRALGLRPAGQEPIILRCRPCGYWPGRVCTRPTYLYRIDRAKPVRPMTLAQERALDRAMEARTRCPKCRRRYHHCLPLRTLGSCFLRTTGIGAGGQGISDISQDRLSPHAVRRSGEREISTSTVSVSPEGYPLVERGSRRPTKGIIGAP
ncbi:RRQRL motif-containing zinc-binding protein [Streptomyces mirabilis]|uniref:RRQRL motif-containing zinc-binding protein n=1 Tax=Streptomyces mirabilis TaxID=68239 RepID=UPI0036DF4CD2